MPEAQLHLKRVHAAGEDAEVEGGDDILTCRSRHTPVAVIRSDVTS